MSMPPAIPTLFSAATCLFSPALLADIDITAEQLAQSGRRMVALDLPPRALEISGKAPLGDGAPCRILSGNAVLWEGAAGAEFRVPIPPNTRKLYLLSRHAGNKDWLIFDIRAEKEPAKDEVCTFHPLIVKAEELGLRAGTHDSCADMRRVLDKAREYGNAAKIRIPKGEYHFYPEGALEMSYYTSNHDQQDIHPVALPLVDFRHLDIDAQGSTFIFHGKMQPVLIMDSTLVTVKNLHLAYKTAYSTEARIVDNSNGKTRVQIADGLFDWKVENDRFFNKGHQWQEQVNNAAVFKPDGRMAPLHHSGDLVWTPKAELVNDNEVLFHQDTAALGLGKGDTLILRSYARPHPAMVIYRSRETTLADVVFHDSQGMALLAQRSEGITIVGGGCKRREGRMHTTAADATHFSNCRGMIRVEKAHYESMMDDAINVHSTCLSIVEKRGPREIISRYMHGQAVGFEVVLAGETLQFIKGPSLENHPTKIKVKAVERLDERHLRVLLEEDLPADIGVGDAWENADWYPSVLFMNNTVRWNRARGALFTTPEPVLVEDNLFYWGSGSAILLAGDAQGWYESGRCLDVTIRGNKFIQNLTSGYQFTEGVISIYPEVKKPQDQKIAYHQNILIEKNSFVTHRVPLIFAISADGIIFRDNEVEMNDLFPARHNGERFVLKNAPKHAIRESGTRVIKKK